MVYYIFQKPIDGKCQKVLRVVKTKKEYFALRDSDYNKKNVMLARQGNDDAKHRLVQFNYSCVPNEDMLLKGIKQPSQFVGMDIDLDPIVGDSFKTGFNPSAENLQHLEERILSKKAELGIVLVERSVKKGFHVVFKRDWQKTQEENLMHASEVLGVPYDKAAKDITRVFFATTSEDVLWLDEEIFSLSPVTNVTSSPLEGKGIDTQTSVQSPQSVSTPLSCGGAGGGSLHYDAIVEEFLKRECETWPVVPEGVRNDTLFNMVAKYLRYCTDHSFDKIKAILWPKYSFGLAETEVDSLIRSALSRERSLTPKVVKEVFQMKNEKGEMKNEACAEDDESGMTQLLEGWTPPELPKKLPRLIELLVKPYEEKYHPMLVVTALTTLGAVASHFRSRYIDNSTTLAPNLYTAIIAGSGQGKSHASRLFKTITKNTLQANDDAEWDKVRENEKLRDRKSNAKDKPEKYQPHFRIAETLSKTSLLQLQSNLGQNGMLMCNYMESDELANSTKAAFSDKSVLLRKGWDGEQHRQYYMSESSCNTQCDILLAVLATGTPKSVLSRLFADTENGMMQRFIPVLLPKTKRTFRPPVMTPLSSDEQAELDGLIGSLWQKDLALGDDTKSVELPKSGKLVEKWFDEQEVLYNEGLMTEAEADLTHRVGQFMMRAAIPFVALYNEESREVLNLMKWLGEFAYYNIRHIFGRRVQNDIEESNELIAQHVDMRKTAEPILDRMPEIFTIQQFKAERLRSGQSDNVKNLLQRYKKSGKIEQISRGVYRKVGLRN